MKNILNSFMGAFLCVGFLSEASALPVMNENVANHGVITIYPDHQDANHFYVAPNVVLIARDADGIPVFLYQEFSTGLFKNSSLLQMTLVPTYTRNELEEAKQVILKNNPKAIFSGLPFMSSTINFSDALSALVEKHDCTHIAGLIGQEQSCQMVLTRRGRKIFRQAIKLKKLFALLQFEYSVEGVARGADNLFAPATIRHGAAAVIDGAQLSEYPEQIIFKKRMR